MTTKHTRKAPKASQTSAQIDQGRTNPAPAQHRIDPALVLGSPNFGNPDAMSWATLLSTVLGSLDLHPVTTEGLVSEALLTVRDDLDVLGYALESGAAEGDDRNVVRRFVRRVEARAEVALILAGRIRTANAAEVTP